MKNKKTVIVAVASLFIFSLLAVSAIAQESNFWNSVIGPFGNGFESAYDNYFPFIDGIIYIIIFIGLSQWSLGSKFLRGSGADKKGGKAVVVGIGLVFALSLALWERSAGFNIKSFGPIAMLVMIGVMCFAFYEGLRNALGKDNISNTDAFLWSYILFVLAVSVFNLGNDMAEKHPKSNIAFGMLNLGALIVLIILLWKGFNFFIGKGGVSTGPVGSSAKRRGSEEDEPQPPGPEPSPTPPNFKPDDPATPTTPPPGEPARPKDIHVPKVPKKPHIPKEKVISVDLSPNFNGIRSQDSIGACTAFASTSILEYIMNVTSGRGKYLSPMYLYYHTRKREHKEDFDSGAPSSKALKTLQEQGTCFENFWKFEGLPSKKFRTAPDMKAEGDKKKKILHFMELDKKDPDQWAHELLTGNPVYLSANVPADWNPSYKKKLYDNFSISSFIGGHGMVIVGYNSHYPYKKRGIPTFKIRNSWGVSWGENGYTWIPSEILLKMVRSGLWVVKGWQKEETGTFTVSGRAVYDDNVQSIGIEKSGIDIYSDKKIEGVSHKFVVGIMVQKKGNLVPLAETVVNNKMGKFSMRFKADFTGIEKLTMLPKHFPRQFKGIDFGKLPAGIAVYKRSIDQKADPNYYFHIASFDHSKAGRGGEGRTHPKNPCSCEARTIAFSGIPIVLDKSHNKEENIIIPVVPLNHVLEDPEQIGIINQVKKFASKEKENLAGEFGFIEKLHVHLKEGSFGDALQLVDAVGRCERVADNFSKKLDDELAELIHKLPAEHAYIVSEIKKELKRLAELIMTNSSRYTGHLRDIIQALIISKKKKADKKTLRYIEDLIEWTDGLIVLLEKAENIDKILMSPRKK